MAKLNFFFDLSVDMATIFVFLVKFSLLNKHFGTAGRVSFSSRINFCCTNIKFHEDDEVFFEDPKLCKLKCTKSQVPQVDIS